MYYIHLTNVKETRASFSKRDLKDPQKRAQKRIASINVKFKYGVQYNAILGLSYLVTAAVINVDLK